ncbi:Phosphoribosylformylglycinamidine synthase [Enhygromyxa salina]|uniref:Phosphoribosylformylglycinamidine synthase n=1 Tax=Enhygromyxa salina TaxID=215803 RepID=A0A2S9YAU0_9BACT|nr:phosphoribosylformylglycinamidine synthase subunit PurQ [Enhygromyxa salina]PRQ02131.1 Phosphoribosylformylglycinamidine synthase [Enhygromyxa salina]
MDSEAVRARLIPELDPRELAQLRVMVPTGYGLNCEAETSAAFELLGAEVERVHVAELLDDPGRLAGVAILAFIGGFSFGDHVASGRVFANRLRFRLGDALARYVADGGLAIGMCNGFQVMVKLGLLPGPLLAADAADRLAPQRASVVGNDRLGYRNAWVRMRCDPESPCVWTRGLDIIESPSRHGEGKLVLADDEIRAQLEAEHRVPVRYVDEQGAVSEAWPANPNGSPGGAAGLCDRSGRVFGLMPHPEAFLYAENHPRWRARADAGDSPGHGLGLRVFANGLRAAVTARRKSP